VEWDYNSDIEDVEPDKQQAPPATVATVSDKTGSIISKACTIRLDYVDHMKARNAYCLPKVAASRTPQLDNFLKMEIQLAAKAADKELAIIQSYVLDALAPPSATLETKEDVPEKNVKAATDAIKLLGNANARISISSPQKGRGAKTCHQPQSSKQFCPHGALQDGGNLHPQRFVEMGRLASKSRLEGCVLHDPNTPITSEVPTISVPGEGLPLYLSPLWPLFSPVGVYKDSEASLVRGESS